MTSTALVSIQKTLLGDESLIESQPANDSILKQSGQSTHWPLSRITTNASPKHDGIAAVCWNRLLVHGANSALPLPSILQISLGNSSFITKAGTGLQPSLNPDQTGYAHMHARAVNTFTIKHNCHKDVACTVGVHVLTHTSAHNSLNPPQTSGAVFTLQRAHLLGATSEPADVPSVYSCMCVFDCREIHGASLFISRSNLHLK